MKRSRYSIDCLSENTLAEVLEGSLSAEHREYVHRHIRSCDACRLLVATTLSALLPEGEDLSRNDKPSLRALLLYCSMGAPDRSLPEGWTPPPTLDEYQVGVFIGGGAMGRVYRGHDVRLDRPVAIKFLAALQPDVVACERFLIEARALARLHHPNVVTCYRIGEVHGRPYLVSELIEGVSLDGLPKPMPWQKALAIGIDLGRGLGAAHQHGVLHRDIKPANAILTSQGSAMLVDFGLAKLGEGRAKSLSPPERSLERVSTHASAGQPEQWLPLELRTDGARQSLTTTGAIVGTPVYMAPEIWRGEQATPRADVYSLGTLLYELCTGSPPHQAATLSELRLRVATVTARPLHKTGHGVHPRLAAIVSRCMAHDPAERYANGDELRAALERLWRSHQTRPLRLQLLAFALLATAVLGGASELWRGRPRKTSLPAGSSIRTRTAVLVPLGRGKETAPSSSSANFVLNLTDVPPEAQELRITAEVDDQRIHFQRRVPADVDKVVMELPEGSLARKVRVEVAAFDRRCSIAAFRAGVQRSDLEPRELTVRLNACRSCFCQESPVAGHGHNGIWAASEDQVWMVGDNAPILRYNGYNWVDETPGELHFLIAIWGIDANNLWAVGGCRDRTTSPCPYPPGQDAAVVMHRTGGAWKKEAALSPGMSQLLGVWASGEDDVWVVGSEGPVEKKSQLPTEKTTGLIAHRDARGWAQLPEGPTMGRSLNGVWGLGPDKVWVVGNGPQGSVIWRHGSSAAARWVPVPLADKAGEYLWNLWGTSETQLWAVGSYSRILRWDGHNWQVACARFNPSPSLPMNNIWGRSAEDVWAVGDRGTLMHLGSTPACWEQVETSVPFDTTQGAPYLSVWGAGRDIWVVGDANVVLHYRPY